MKLKRFLSIFLLIFCVSSMLTSSFVYANSYQYNAYKHWQVDSEGKKIGEEVPHNLENGVCTICGCVPNSFNVNGDIKPENGVKINGIEGVGTYTVSTIINDSNIQTKDKMTDILNKYRGLISALSGGGALTMLLFFIINFGKLGASAGNPQQRQSALMGLLFTGIATALLGSIMIFFQFFYHALG